MKALLDKQQFGAVGARHRGFVRDRPRIRTTNRGGRDQSRAGGQERGIA